MVIWQTVSKGCPSEQKHLEEASFALSVTVVTDWQLVCVSIVCESVI